MNRCVPLLVLVSGTIPLFAHAYELGTHARITQHAHQRSVLATDETLLRDLGVTELDPKNPFGAAYYDVFHTRSEQRFASRFAETEGRMPDKANPFSIEGWLMRGAIREDDFVDKVIIPGIGGCTLDAPNPEDDPYPDAPDRPINHFYDPVFDRALRLSQPFDLLLGPRQKAPDWALGTADVFAAPNTPDTSRRNHFTVFDAREAQYRALTGRNKQNELRAPTSGERRAYFVYFLRSEDGVWRIESM